MSSGNSPDKSESHFSTTHLVDDLTRRSVRGGAVTFIGQFTKFVLQLGSTMVLARLLTPQDFGLIAMASAVTGFIMIFKDLGLSAATVQKSEVNHAQISTLFWINVGVSICAMLLMMALAPAIAWFYSDPRFTSITLVLAMAFVFGGLTVQHQALLRRQMRYMTLAMIDVSAIITGIIVGLVSAFLGLGYWSLVLMSLVTAMTMTLGVWIGSGWVPGPPVRGSGVRPMLSFGGYLTGFSIMNYFSRNLDTVLLGRYWGAEATGLYSKAYALLLLPVGQITAPMAAVAVPALSRLQNEPERFRSYYLKALRLIAYISMPFSIAMFVLAEEIVAIFFGAQWVAAGSIFRILSIAAIVQPVMGTAGWIYVSLGQTKRQAIWGLISAPTVVASFIIGLPWGAEGVATCYVTGVVLRFYPCFAFSLKYSSLSPKDVLAVVFRPLLIGAVCGAAVYVSSIYLADRSLILEVMGSLFSGAVAALLFTFLWSSARKDVSGIIKAGKLLFRNRE